MGDRGAVHLGGTLKENQVLQFLDISSNRIKLSGATSIADGLRENQTLRSLQLNGNPIGDQGVVLVIEAVGEQCSLRDLGVQDCSTFKSADGIFDKKNPTGHYELELQDAFDLDRFAKLRALDKQDEASGLDNFINMKLDGKAVQVPLDDNGDPDIHSWNPPATGVLRFDYVSQKKAPREAKPQRDEVFQSFKKELSNPALSEDTKLLMLRSAATTHFWSANQTLQLVKQITFQRRVDAVVMLFKRIVDEDQVATLDLASSSPLVAACSSLLASHSDGSPVRNRARKFYSEVWSELKSSERTAVRYRLGAGFAQLLAKHEPEERGSTTAIAFLTEMPEEAMDGGEVSSGDGGGGGGEGGGGEGGGGEGAAGESSAGEEAGFAAPEGGAADQGEQSAAEPMPSEAADGGEAAEKADGQDSSGQPPLV